MPFPGRWGGAYPLLLIDENYKVIAYPPQYMASQLITREWVQPIDAPHKLFKASSDITDAAGNVLVTAYAVERPDGKWSVMLVNRDQHNDHAVKLVFNDGPSGHDRHFSGPVDRITFGSKEYKWQAEGDRGGHADPDGPPTKSNISGSPDTLYTLPMASITVLRGSVGAR